MLDVWLHHEDIQELAYLRFLKLNLEYQNIKMGSRTHKHLLFLSWDYVLNQHHTIEYHRCFYSCSLFNKAAIIIAILGQKTLHWQLSNVLPSGKYNCIWGNKLGLKAYVRYFYQIFIFSPNDSPSKTMKFFISKSSFPSQDTQIFVIFSLPFHTFQTQKDKWKRNLWCHELACINLQVRFSK